ncbi:MAG: hypothetical protein GY934_24785, partial [Gammaproteobacteria bacterium]|nr:hypothetical protein [Gammaproteobacteria bacterium]
EAELKLIGLGEQPMVTLTAGGDDIGKRWSAEIARSENVIDQASRLTYLVARVADPYGRAGTNDTVLLFGSFVAAEISGKEYDHVATLPRHVLRGRNQLYTVNQENRLQIREISLLRGDAESLFVASGLEPGDRVITTAIEAPVTGMLLRVEGDLADSAGLGSEKVVTTQSIEVP